MYTPPVGPVELSPLDVVMVGLMLEAKFCTREEYSPGVCEAEGCRVCLDLMITTGGTA